MMYSRISASSSATSGQGTGRMSTVLTERLVAAARAAGLGSARLCRAVDLSPEALEDAEAHVSLEQHLQLWELAVQQTGCRQLPYVAARSCQIDTLKLLGYACMTSANLAEALRRMARFLVLWVDGQSLRFDECTEPRLVLWQSGNPRPGRSYEAEFTLARIVLDARTMAGVEISPVEVRFAHPAPEDTLTAEQLFGCPVKYDQPVSELIFDRVTVELPLAKADAGFAEFFGEHMEKKLAQLAPSEDVVAQVRRTVIDALQKGDPSLSTVAKRLGCSPRTLRRRLSATGTNFRAIVDEVRCELAKRYLAREDVTLTEVAFALGFSEPSNFHRAFKRWTAVTPDRFRRALLHGQTEPIAPQRPPQPVHHGHAVHALG